MSVNVGDLVAIPGSSVVHRVLEIDSRPLAFKPNPRVKMVSLSSGRVTTSTRRNRLQRVEVIA